MRSMPLFKTGHQPKTHMATQFSIDEEDRARYDASVNDPDISAEEKEVRAAIVKWARSQSPNGGDWIFVWTTWG